MRRGPCVFVSIEVGRSPDAEKKVRGLARRVKSDIALRQRRAGMRRIHETISQCATEVGKRLAHVVGERGRAVRPQATQMGGDQLAVVEDLHRLCSVPGAPLPVARGSRGDRDDYEFSRRPLALAKPRSKLVGQGGLG